MAKFLVYFLLLILVEAHLMVMASRKLGKHTLSPSEAPKADENGEFATEVSATGGEGGEEEVMKINHHHRQAFDKSVAGGGVILGGLATTFLVAIVCYIRATRRRSAEPLPGSPTNSDSSIGIGNTSGEPRP